LSKTGGKGRNSDLNDISPPLKVVKNISTDVVGKSNRINMNDIKESGRQSGGKPKCNHNKDGPRKNSIRSYGSVDEDPSSEEDDKT